MINTIALIFSISFLAIGLWVSMPKPKQNIEVYTVNAKIAQVWMMASAIMLAIGYLVNK
jgi:hypothetical protein